MGVRACGYLYSNLGISFGSYVTIQGRRARRSPPTVLPLFATSPLVLPRSSDALSTNALAYRAERFTPVAHSTYGDLLADAAGNP
jgi:hypothetical protein